MLRFDDIVFGPLHSRRLGSSLGINLLPSNGKLCNFDCIYCECGWNKDGRVEHPVLPSAQEVEEALNKKLREYSAGGITIDSITFSGNGEPTLHPDFPEIIDITLSARNLWYPEAKVSVLSNSTMLMSDKVFVSLKKVDNPILKIDASTIDGAMSINRPSCNYDIRRIVERMKEFEGKFILQTMFLRSEDFDSSHKLNLDGWMDIVRETGPRLVMVYTIDRETPQKGLKKFSIAEMENFVRPLVEEGYNIQIKG